MVTEGQEMNCSRCKEVLDNYLNNFLFLHIVRSRGKQEYYFGCKPCFEEINTALGEDLDNLLAKYNLTKMPELRRAKERHD